MTSPRSAVWIRSLPTRRPFWRLTARYDVLRGEESERRWGLILHGIALMTKTGGDTIGRSAHVRGLPVGRALFTGGDVNRTTAFYSESRFNRLLTARGADAEGAARQDVPYDGGDRPGF